MAKQAFHSEDTEEEDEGEEDSEEASPKAVGHNIYILAHQVRLLCKYSLSLGCQSVCLIHRNYLCIHELVY